ncbi:chemotaxis protein CheA [Tropicibacter sp. Alg240-R139]|uniref:chemotaxis protein CheA n=1 Tax=Tropicibacter sp. Alg240-R139 TaxID=2305991 RepID=UPI0013E01AB4|nr:chemotaxis protein CheA [Tropicibacter sp. Alg240-R139]
MVQNNKVLTVSYGTFSCTLEGFEDSFDTMKAIAEYFRDLASDDRYFGAEPPQPDADMLARIAQREISRQVEARTDSKGIVLRAAEAVAPVAADVVEAQPEPDPAPAPAAEPDAAPVEEAHATEAEQENAPTVTDESPVEAPSVEATEEIAAATSIAAPAAAIVVEEAPAEEEAEQVVAEVEEIEEQIDEDPVAESQPPEVEPEATEVVSEETPIDEAEHVETIEAAPIVEIEDAADESTAEDLDEAPEVAADVEPDATDTDEDAALAAIAARVADPKDEAPIVEAEPVENDDTVPAADSIAAKLQRIRAVVSRNEKAAQTETYAEDEHADDVVTAAAVGLTAALQADEDVEDQDEAGDEADDVTAILDTLDVEDDADTVDMPQEDALFSDLGDSGADDADDELDNILNSGETPEKSAPIKARVLKVKRSDLEAAIAAGELQAADEETNEDNAQNDASQEDAVGGSSLLPEDEADLMRELAAVEAELNAHSDDDDDELPQMEPEAEDGAEVHVGNVDDVAKEQDAESERETPEEAPKLEADEDDLSRLMATADEKLDDPDTSSSREAYTHLRAAVAAAHAERSAGGTVGTHTSDDDYREDLASVVRPRRPTAKASSPRPRAGGDRPAPLKLVAEQRIDVPTETQNRGPVRPRRVASVVADDPNNETGNGFADYAAEQGAVSLPDLLEAAAAYMSFVEGREQFSRPQLMNKVRQLDNQSFNREDGLRSFGQLLRDGKIEKAGGGRFVASGDIGFHPGKRAAG